MGKKLMEHYDGAEGWAKRLIADYDNTANETAKSQAASRITNALEAFDSWEREEPEVVPSEITDDQLVAAVEYLMNNKNALAASQSRPFGT